MRRHTRPMAALPAHNPLHHDTDDAEKILRVFGEWQQEWDEPNGAIQDDAFAAQVQFAIQCYSDGMLPLAVRWKLAETYGKRCKIGQVERAVQKALLSLDKAPRELQLALVRLQRANVLQKAMACGQLGVALKALDREGDRLGELSGESGLGPDDLRLTVEIEGDGALPLEPGTEEAIQAPTEQAETVETGETGG